ncbi:MAG: hypothetical protein WCO51_10925, partial [bacterium]
RVSGIPIALEIRDLAAEMASNLFQENTPLFMWVVLQLLIIIHQITTRPCLFLLVGVFDREDRD